MGSVKLLILLIISLGTPMAFGQSPTESNAARDADRAINNNPTNSEGKFFSDTHLCDDVLGERWPIIQNGIKYEVRVAEDPIDGLHPVLIRIPVNPDGSYKLDVEGKVIRSIKPLAVDDLTGSLLASEATVKNIMNMLINHASRSKERMAFVFIDLNDLKFVNNFVNKQVDGDSYIRIVSEVVRSVCQMIDYKGACSIDGKARKQEDIDWVFRDGGDELVLLVPNVSSSQLVKIMERIREKLLIDTNAHAIFERQRAHTKKMLYNALNRLNDNIKLKIESLLGKNFNQFDELKQALLNIDVKNKHLIDLIKNFDTARRLHPSVSMGSAFIGRRDNYNTLKKRTSRQAYSIKADYKRRMGLEPGKYGVETSNTTDLIVYRDGEIPLIEIRKPLRPLK
ncbi:MAG: GGDEF domain-containing protein [Bdellovibrionaceae bacterium]|nr:GGDEF domain-containing protein [Pseudobdellovibrionaceae bacterium]